MFRKLIGFLIFPPPEYFPPPQEERGFGGGKIHSTMRYYNHVACERMRGPNLEAIMTGNWDSHSHA